MVQNIQDSAAQENDLSHGGIFQGRFNGLLLDQLENEQDNFEDQKTDNQIITVNPDGSNAPKQFKYKQYNRLIKKQQMGKSTINPKYLVLGVKKSKRTCKYKVDESSLDHDEDYLNGRTLT